MAMVKENDDEPAETVKPLPQPGRYELVVLLNGHPLASQYFNAEDTGESGRGIASDNETMALAQVSPTSREADPWR